jgi:hypothetical protein
VYESTIHPRASFWLLNVGKVDNVVAAKNEGDAAAIVNVLSMWAM